MKKIIRYILPLMAMVVVFGCDAFKSITSVNSTPAHGSPYERIVVCDHKEWKGELGDSLRAILTTPIQYINTKEPIFDVLRILPNGFDRLISKHRNILKVLVDPKIEKAEIVIQYDVSASSQIVVTLQAPTQELAAEYLSENRETLVSLLEKTERDRIVNYAANYNELGIKNVIKSKFGFDMNVPKGYVLADSTADFMWARYEYPTASQGFFIYSYPYTNKSQLTEKMLVDARNTFATKIPGPSAGSFMTTAFTLDYQAFVLNDRHWIELKGFWDVDGDFMGGPFVSYTTIDKLNKRVITIDGYIFSPKDHKRNYLRGVENLIYMVDMPKKK